MIADDYFGDFDGGTVLSGAANKAITMRVSNTLFIRNQGIFRGAALRNSSLSTLIVNNCTFALNVADSGAAIDNTSFALVTNCTFANNFATELPGGAIVNRTSNANVTIRGCTFFGNTAPAAQGGAALSNDTASVMNFGNNIFSAGATGGTVKNANPQANSFISTGKNISSDAVGGDSQTAPGGFLNGSGDRRNTNPKITGA